MTMLILSWTSLIVIFVLSLVMVLSCYDSGIIGAAASAFMAVSASVVMLEFDQYALSKPTVVLELGFAIFLMRHFWRFQQFRRRRAREDAQVIDVVRIFGA